MAIKKCSFYLQNADLLVHSDHKPLLKIFTGGLYHDLDFKDHQQEFSAPFEPMPPVEPVIHMPLEVNEIFIAPNIEKLMQNYDALHDFPTAQTDEA